MTGIVISYRREDSSYIAGRLSDRLSAHFGSDRIFRDIDTIRPGTDFVEQIERAVASCDAVVVVIGDEWLTAEDPGGVGHVVLSWLSLLGWRRRGTIAAGGIRPAGRGRGLGAGSGVAAAGAGGAGSG